MALRICFSKKASKIFHATKANWASTYTFCSAKAEDQLLSKEKSIPKIKMM